MSDVLARGEIRINVERKKACMTTLIGIILVCIQCCTMVTPNLDGTLASVTVQYMPEHFMFGLRWYEVCMHMEYTDHTT